MSLAYKAMVFAQKKHRGQKDDEDEDYFLAHIRVVAELIAEVTDDDEIIAAAYLHDTLEDTATTLAELEERFGKRVASLVHEVTHEGKKDEHGYYFPRLKTKDAILIKFADRISNLSRMGAWGAERQVQYLKQSKFWRSEPNTEQEAGGRAG